MLCIVSASCLNFSFSKHSLLARKHHVESKISRSSFCKRGIVTIRSLAFYPQSLFGFSCFFHEDNKNKADIGMVLFSCHEPATSLSLFHTPEPRVILLTRKENAADGMTVLHVYKSGMNLPTGPLNSLTTCHGTFNNFPFENHLSGRIFPVNGLACFILSKVFNRLFCLSWLVTSS